MLDFTLCIKKNKPKFEHNLVKKLVKGIIKALLYNVTKAHKAIKTVYFKAF